MRRAPGILPIKRRLIQIVALSVIFFSACDSNVPGISNEQGSPIQFTQTQTSTKADIVEQSSLAADQTIGVLAYHLPADGVNEAIWNDNAIPNFMYDQKMTATDNGQLTYSPIKYWPGNQRDKIKFFAYAPHSSEANGITLSSAAAKGYPTLYYAPNKDVSRQADLLVAVTEPLNSGGVRLNFKHALTQVSFSARCTNNAGSETITISSITLSDVANGNGEFTDTGFQWTASPHTQAYTLTVGQAISEGNLVNLPGSLFLVPQTTGCKLDIELTVGSTPMRTSQADLPTTDWAAGKKINYQLTIDLNNLLPL